MIKYPHEKRGDIDLLINLKVLSKFIAADILTTILLFFKENKTFHVNHLLMISLNDNNKKEKNKNK